MSVSAETYIVISLMFAVFAAVAAVGTSVVLGAGFERLRAGFDVVRRQSGFFADAIYKLDQRTQKLDEETAKLKAGAYSLDERVNRVEKTSTFLADSINSIEQRILQGTPVQPQATREPVIHVAPPAMARRAKPKIEIHHEWAERPAMRNDMPQREPENLMSGLYRDYPEKMPANRDEELPESIMEEAHDTSGGLTTLLSRYLTGESSGGGKGVVYH